MIVFISCDVDKESESIYRCGLEQYYKFLNDHNFYPSAGNRLNRNILYIEGMNDIDQADNKMVEKCTGYAEQVHRISNYSRLSDELVNMIQAYRPNLSLRDYRVYTRRELKSMHHERHYFQISPIYKGVNTHNKYILVSYYTKEIDFIIILPNGNVHFKSHHLYYRDDDYKCE